MAVSLKERNAEYKKTIISRLPMNISWFSSARVTQNAAQCNNSTISVHFRRILPAKVLATTICYGKHNSNNLFDTFNTLAEP